MKRLLSRWSRPTQVNGVLEFYSIFLSRDGSEPVLVYNSSELLEDHTLRGLTPGRAYAITLAVSDSSCVLSEPRSGLHWRRVSLSGLHRGRLHAQPSRPGSHGGEQPGGRSRTSGDAFVPTRRQRELDASSYSKR